MRSVSVVAPIQKRPWLTVGVSVGLALLLTVGAAVMLQPGRRFLSRGGAAVEERVPQLSQARWRFDTVAAGGNGKLSKRESAAVRRQRAELRSTLKTIYDGIFVDPAKLGPALKANFSRAAARSFRKAGVGAAEAGTVRTTHRRAEIAMQPLQGVRRAIATVTVRAVEVGPKRKVFHRATLWMERPNKTWKVIAFDLSQNPIAERSKKTAGKGKNKSKSKKGSGTKSSGKKKR